MALGGASASVGRALGALGAGFAVGAAPLLQYITNATGAPGKGVAMSAVLKKDKDHSSTKGAQRRPPLCAQRRRERRVIAAHLIWGEDAV